MSTSREKQTKEMQDQQSLAERPLEARIPDPQLPAEVQGEIGRQLRQVYGRLLAEPLPDRFNDLLAELSRSEDKS